MIAIGIDPGVTGAIAFVDGRGSCVIEDLPTLALPGEGRIGRRIDGAALAKIIRANCPIGIAAEALVEGERAMGGKNSAVRIHFSLGRTVGSIEAVLEVLRIPHTAIDPQKWKGFYGLGEIKRESIQKAAQLYPLSFLKQAKDHNKAEALLIAHYLKRHAE